MDLTALTSIVAAAVLGLLMCFQTLLAAGFPFGAAAWGGQHRALPAKLRWASLAAVGTLAAAAWVVLAGAGLVAPGSEPTAVRVAIWVFAAYFAFNTLANAASKNPPERFAMTPASALLAACFVIVALG